MANLDLVQQPTANGNGLALVATNNPIQFQFKTATIGSATSAYAYVWINGPTVPPATQVTFNGRVYEASDDPDFSQFLTTTSATLLEVANSLRLMLENDPNNHEYGFEILNSGVFIPSVFIFAKKAGTAYDITLTVGSGLTVIGLSGGLDQYRGQQLDSYKVWAKLVTNPMIAFAQYLGAAPAFAPGSEVLADYDLQWSADNKHFIDVSGVCQPQASHERPSTALGIHRQASPIKAFFIEYGESWVPTGMTNTRLDIVGRSNVFYGLNSALATLAANDLTAYVSRQPLQKFLTEQPQGRSIRETDIDWLAFVWYTPVAVQRWIGVYVQCTYYDGSTQVVGIFQKTQMTAGYHTVRIDPASWAMAAWQNTQGKLVRDYDLYLVESATASFAVNYKFSEVRKLVIDRLCPSEGMIQFAWLETIGGWSGFSFFGELQTDIERQVSTYQRSRANEFTTQDVLLAVNAIDLSYVNTANSGTVDKITYNWLRDSMLKSPAAYIVAGSLLIPIVITEHAASSSSEDLTFSLTVSFVLSAPVNAIRG